MPTSSDYRNKDGATFGLFKRFYWDENNVPFGGKPNYKSQGGVDPCKYNDSLRLKGNNIKGGQFNNEVLKEQDPEGPAPVTYFIGGRSELKK